MWDCHFYSALSHFVIKMGWNNFVSFVYVKKIPHDIFKYASQMSSEYFVNLYLGVFIHVSTCFYRWKIVINNEWNVFLQSFCWVVSLSSSSADEQRFLRPRWPLYGLKLRVVAQQRSLSKTSIKNFRRRFRASAGSLISPWKLCHKLIINWSN